MKRSTQRILTTHTGSLPRPKDLLRLLQDREEGRLNAEAALHDRTRAAVFDVVKKQTDTTNFIEHPELVAERMARYASVVGRDNVIAGVDCGFGTFAGRVQVDTNIVWHKLRALVEGARLASAALW